MKRIFIFLFTVLIFMSLCSCKKTDSGTEGNDNSSQFDTDIMGGIIGESPDMPIKIIYQRNRMYSAIFETEDAEIIGSVMAALGRVKTLSRSNEAVEDHEDIINLIYEDGSKKIVRFEYKRLLYNDERYDVNGYNAVISALSPIVTEE